jgi:hypothetical protein
MASPDEFAQVMGFIAAATGKSLSVESQVVYFDLLGDLPMSVLQLAAKKVCLRHRYPTFPSVAEIRACAVEVGRGEVTAGTGAEAFAQAWSAVRRIDPEIEGSFERATKGLPPLVVKAMLAMGVCSMVASGDPVGVIRGQFLRIYEQLAESERQTQAIPERDRQAIEKNKPAIGAARTIVQSIADVFQAGEKR